MVHSVMTSRTLREEVLAFLARTGRTQRGWADELGITPAYLSQIMQGDRVPALALAIRMADQTGISIRLFVPDAPTVNA